MNGRQMLDRLHQGNEDPFSRTQPRLEPREAETVQQPPEYELTPEELDEIIRALDENDDFLADDHELVTWN